MKEKNHWDSDVLFKPSLTTYEEEEPKRSGLLDYRGQPLVRKKERIGFIPND